MESNSPVKFRCPIRALRPIAEQLRLFGCCIYVDTPTVGTVEHTSGRLRFWHCDETLYVEIIENRGHFSRALLIGGMRQVVEEVVESLGFASSQAVASPDS